MSGIAIFAPDQKIYEISRKLYEEDPGHIRKITLTGGGHTITDARKAVSEGITVIIARGYQASMIRRHTNVPVVDITMTAQELGLLIKQMKNKIGKKHPGIGLIGSRRMFCDTTYLGELFEAEIRIYETGEEQNYRQMVEAALADHMDGIIGGKDVLSYLEGRDMITVYFESTRESVKNAIDQAEAIYQVSEQEKQNAVQFTSVLESAANGILKVDRLGNITVMNHAMEVLLGKSAEDVTGMEVTSLLKGLDKSAVNRVLAGPSESYAAFVKEKQEHLAVLMTPIVVEEQVTGAVFSLSRFTGRESNASRNKEAVRQIEKQYLKGYAARNTFETIKPYTRGMADVIELAKCCALSGSPVLLTGEGEEELEELSQAIHNHSPRRPGPYISIHLAGLSDEDQTRLLFGAAFINPYSRDRGRGAVSSAENGTLVIHGLDTMGLGTQSFLSRLIRKNAVIYNDLEHIQYTDVRIIGICRKSLEDLYQRELFLGDLYYMFCSMSLCLAPLNKRPEDTEYLLEAYLKHYMERYQKFHVLSEHAKKVLLQYPWNGGRIQLERFCERLVLTAGKRTISEGSITKLLADLYEGKASAEGTQTAGEQSSYEQLLKDTLKQYHGNKGLTAKALQISTTTLWRKMKKYGIDNF